MRKIKNILLVYPEVPSNTYWSFRYALRFIRKKSAMPPLGLITVAALFPDRYNLKLIDMNIDPLADTDILWADCVFVSAMIVQKESMEKVISACNRLEKTVVAGGPYPTSSAHEIDGADHIVKGEVEDTFKSILDDIEAGTALKIYPRPEMPDISASVIPRFDLLNMKAYNNMSVQYSRGCPFNCEFCDIWKLYGNKPRLKSTDNMIAELDTLYFMGWRGSVFIVDDNFIGNKKRVKTELLPALKTWQELHRYAFRFFTEASINMAGDEELLAGMQKAGFNEVFIGIETPSTDSLKETGKKQNLNVDMEKAVKTIQSYGIGVMGGFILGFDSDGDDIFDRQISFIQQTGIPQAMIGLLIALPGTDLYRRLSSEGRILCESAGNNTHSMTTNFRTIMNPSILREGYRKVLASIYDSNLKNYFSRCNMLMDNLKNTSHFQRKIGFKELLMFIKSLVRQPFTRYGFQYLKFIARNMIRNSHIFGEAVRFSIIGHHFHTITRETLKVEKIANELDAGYRYLCEQINSYSEAVCEHSAVVTQSIVELWEQRVELLEKTHKQIKKIHVDFRDDITQKYADISEKMNALFKNFENDIKQGGRRITA